MGFLRHKKSKRMVDLHWIYWSVPQVLAIFSGKMMIYDED
jgi:hypothetical protein